MKGKAYLWATLVVRDIPYAKYDDRELTLDIYLPSRADERRAMPGVMVVRGGGWRSGDKEAFAFIAGQLAKEGFVAASIEYRTSTEARFPAAVNDVKAAVRWMRTHSATHRVDPSALGAIGGSAGAHLVPMLATSGGVTGLEGSGGSVPAPSGVQAVVAVACVCHLQLKDAAVRQFIGEPIDAHADVIKMASPVTYVSRWSPLLLLHSRTDPVVPFEQSEEISVLYRDAGAFCRIRNGRQARHDFSAWGLRRGPDPGRGVHRTRGKIRIIYARVAAP